MMQVEKAGLRVALAAGVLAAATGAQAQNVVKVGFIGEMSGPFAEFGKQMETGIQIFLKEHGDTVAGKRVVVIVKDVGGPNPELAKRHAQELVVREKVDVLAGFAFSPNAFAVAPIATEAKKPLVIMNAASGALPAASPYIVRTSFSLPAIVPPISAWMLRQGYKTAYSLVADYSPGHEVETAFLDSYKQAGGTVAGSVRTPLTTMDFSAYMQKIKDIKPAAVFAFVNGADVAQSFMREYRARKLEEAGTAMVGTGDITDEPTIDSMGDAPLGAVTGYPYSMDHDSPKNKQFVAAFKAARGQQARPNIMAVAGYDGMALIYEALRKTQGKTDGDAIIAAMKGVKLESPRGPIEIDAATRDVKQRVYMRKVERVDGRMANIEFEAIEPK